MTNFSNRLVRTRMPGGVAGARLTAAPYADQGEQQDVDKADWQTLRDTGLIHLIAISGMHIGLIA